MSAFEVMYEWSRILPFDASSPFPFPLHAQRESPAGCGSIGGNSFPNATQSSPHNVPIWFMVIGDNGTIGFKHSRNQWGNLINALRFVAVACLV